ncbi:MAG: class I SAM-dependent methyltransferase [Deltaproteobacteria bacterium]|jgi:ubiquinone/menaquinone biosynthesis C-methylase UbiE|nr:class I SAM-dependent methyltransferase [Deltaproteobacteria bacterium]
MNFKDYFSKQASEYTKYRPHYPEALFEYLATLVFSHQRAWDCATGSGQAALGLTPYFEEIIATDASEKQIANVFEHKKIIYRIAPAEKTGIESHSVDLIVVAQALHWFELDRFYTEARRVLQEGGVLAVWSYSLLRISSAIDRVLDHFYTKVVGPFWPPERKLVDDKYQSISFPFEELAAPPFKMETRWNLDRLVGYLGTWSSVQKFKDKHDTDPIEVVIRDLRRAWGNPEDEKGIHWPIHMRVGRVQ